MNRKLFPLEKTVANFSFGWFAAEITHSYKCQAIHMHIHMYMDEHVCVRACVCVCVCVELHSTIMLEIGEFVFLN